MSTWSKTLPRVAFPSRMRYRIRPYGHKRWSRWQPGEQVTHTYHSVEIDGQRFDRTREVEIEWDLEIDPDARQRKRQ